MSRTRCDILRRPVRPVFCRRRATRRRFLRFLLRILLLLLLGREVPSVRMGIAETTHGADAVEIFDPLPRAFLARATKNIRIEHCLLLSVVRNNRQQRLGGRWFCYSKYELILCVVKWMNKRSDGWCYEKNFPMGDSTSDVVLLDHDDVVVMNLLNDSHVTA